jgi:hypothetical protein
MLVMIYLLRVISEWLERRRQREGKSAQHAVDSEPFLKTTKSDQ